MTIGNKTACILYFTLALIVLQTNLCGAEEKAAQMLPVYRLSVSFDLKSHLLRGRAAITLPNVGDTTVSTGNLIITSVTLNGLPLAYRAKDNLFKITGTGTLEISYEGTFEEKPGSSENL